MATRAGQGAKIYVVVGQYEDLIIVSLIIIIDLINFEKIPPALQFRSDYIVDKSHLVDQIEGAKSTGFSHLPMSNYVDWSIMSTDVQSCD